jgi:hypothetical protein
MGRITTSDAIVSEAFQKAIIFHNLEEEILVLGTDLKADEATTVLRFIPFPSEPVVSLVEGNPFQRVSELMKEHEMVFLQFSKSGSSSALPVEVAFSAKIGAHDVTVICINEIAEFRSWVAGFLEGKGLVPGDDYQPVEHVASDYVKRDIKYFVFDLVEITPEAQFVEPIAYRFKSNELYYPLKTSNTFGGSGGIDLTIIAPRILCDTGPFSQALYIDRTEDIYESYPCLSSLSKKRPFSYPVRTSTTAELSRAEVRSIHAPARNFFDKKEAILMQLIRYYGEYDFDEDILIDISEAPRENIYKFEASDLYDPFAELNLGGLVERIEAIPPAIVDKDLVLKEACLKATLSAIEIEIERFEQRLIAAVEGPGDSGNVLTLEKRIDELLDAYEKYRKMRPADYLLPEKKTVKVKTTQPSQQDSVLELKGMSRSGPFYHAAGIEGNGYEVLKSDKTYRMTIYLVYPRDYPFPSNYVYIENFK